MGLRQQHLVNPLECGHNRPQSCTCSGPTCPDIALHSAANIPQQLGITESLKEAGFHMKTLQLNYKVTQPIITSHILLLSVCCPFRMYCSLSTGHNAPVKCYNCKQNIQFVNNPFWLLLL